ASANAGWLHLSTLFQSGTGSGFVFFSFDSNPGPTRTGTITIANQTLTVIQAGATYQGYNDSGPFGTAAAVIFTNSDYSSSPLGVAVDRVGNAFFSDYSANIVYEWIKTNNTVIPVVSNGLSEPYGVALDNAGNLYISEPDHNDVKKWSVADGTVSTLV